MNDLCDGVITLPGALELLKSFLKCLLGLNLDFTKPIAVLNTNGFYDALLVLLETMVKKGFLKEVNYQMLLVSDDIEDLLNQMKIM
jgi:predicted Rossmann-fold nucleotide-binding protein